MSVREELIADPAKLRATLVDIDEQIATADAEWERLDNRGDASAFLKMTPMALRLEELRTRAAAIPPRIVEAERRRAAFLELARLFEQAGSDVRTQLRSLLEHPPQEPQSRVARLRALDHATKIHVRLAARLRVISTDPSFREPADALKILRDDLHARIREVDRLRVPGMKEPLVWPPQMIELLETLEGRN